MTDDETRRSSADRPCPTCGERGSWSSSGPDRMYTPPPGHTVHRLGRDLAGIAVDSCPLTIFVPDLQIDL